MSSQPALSSENELIEALAVCLDAMAVGSDLETCLGMYPALANELRPLLLTAQTAQVLSPAHIPTDAMHRSRTKMLGQAAILRTQQPARPGFWAWTQRIPRFALGSLLTVVVLFAAFFTANSVSASALPGDPLYSLKLSFENLYMGLTPGSQAQDTLEQVYRERRIDEVRELLALGREENVTFEGVLASRDLLSGIAPERWLVSDVSVLTTIDTQVIGDIEIGMLIEVVGRTRSDGFVEASLLRPRAFAFVGIVEAITSDVWTVGGRQVGIHEDTELAPGLGLGNEVMVLAEFDDEATLFARAILFSGSPDVTPEVTSEVSPTAVEPTVTPTAESPTISPTPQPTEEGLPSPTVSPSPTSTPSPEPTATAPVVSTPTEPEDDDDDDNATPAPATETEEPTETNEPTETEEPEATEAPTSTEEADDNGNTNDNSNSNDNTNSNDDANDSSNDNGNG
ncbi:MAG TPA: DUF5666 domain-containing protein [Anaerolineales bacterium]|nr:DUF5666 domain-containing protein [Anaerolineales bacterium]